jgi:DNA modification methylase
MSKELLGSLQLDRIYQFDCIEGMKLIPSKTISLVVTDPPYLHDKGGNGGGHTKIATSAMYAKDSKVISEMSEFTKEKCWAMLNEIDRVMIKMNAYFFCNDSLIPHYLNWALDHKYKYTILTWNKPLSILNRERFSTNMEYIIRIYSKGTALNKLDIDNNPDKKQYYSKYQYFPQIKGKNKYHPTQKPIEYISGLIELSSNDGDIILDPFMGSGTTGVAAKNLNRKFIGFEIDAKYIELSNKRLESEYNEQDDDLLLGESEDV